MSTNEVDASTAAHGSPLGIRRFIDSRPFRRKLNLLVGVPLTVVAVLLAYLITEQLSQSSSASDAARLVRASAEVATLVDRVEAEHQQAILLSVRHEAGGEGAAPPSTDAYDRAQSAVDRQVIKVRETFGDRLPEGEARALREISALGSLRDTIEQGYLPADNIDPAYTSAANGVIDGLELDRNAGLAATFTGNLLDSLLRADAAHSAFETGVFSASTGDSNALIEFIGAVGSHEVYTYQADRFARFATAEQAEELRGIEHSSPQARIKQQFAELQIDPSGLQSDSPAEIRRSFRAALDSYPAYREQAEIRLGVTASLIDQIADRADDASGEAAWRAGLLLALALLGFSLWFVLSVLVRRSVVRPVQALTGAAREVAEIADRELARVADDDAEDDRPPRLREVPVTARDEIGDLAEAFNRVQTTAAALLERQVLSRRNVAEMFGNVGRRVSNLTTRQLALIDAVERGETDPELLERLYSIDHIAVRLRRNADSLMLLAGIRESGIGSGPLALTTVVRAALGQIEGFQRVRLQARSEAAVEPDVIGDLTLMVAELLENAVSFSPAGSPVEVTVAVGADGESASIVIADHGLGMSAERLAEENARLVRRERLDLVPTKVLGLFVVGTLARRWEIGVTLTRTPGGGVTAEVNVPSSLLLPVPEAPEPAAKAPLSARSPEPVKELASARIPEPARTPPSAGTSAPAGTSASSRTSAPAGTSATGTTSASAGASATGTTSAPAATPATKPTGPLPSVAADAGPLPRRLPRREAPAPAVPSDDHARAEQPEASPKDHASGSRPLRRRVRGATLRTAQDSGAQQALRRAPRPADADAVRSALEEFEAAVERAHRDSGSESTQETPTPDTHHQNHLPEGAEQ
ncbi:HAMP domain-containing protein [Streptomyces sp. GXMU-J15]|uniref:histidine kinase n=1 Tax=Streptomyces fuscus TaxID=3048495 RepID=A0ABT7JA42_9ACTN|nr:ATP-binding protein [Streptomyces fuscus]MDL2081236.1 HAMP domain-containing protein [Streptomyces fuscus]